MANTCQEETAIISWRECSKPVLRLLEGKSLQSCPEGVEGKAANGLGYPEGDNPCLTRGAYMEYVSTAKWRERRWRLFSTFPQ